MSDDYRSKRLKRAFAAAAFALFFGWLPAVAIWFVAMGVASNFGGTQWDMGGLTPADYFATLGTVWLVTVAASGIGYYKGYGDAVDLGDHQAQVEDYWFKREAEERHMLDPVACPDCGVMCDNKDNMEQHRAAKHPGASAP